MDTKYEWNEAKNKENIKKHKISFYDAVEVFHDPMQRVRHDDQNLNGESRRNQTIGQIRNGKILIVVHFDFFDHHGVEVIQIISARKANSFERKIYAESKTEFQ